MSGNKATEWMWSYLKSWLNHLHQEDEIKTNTVNLQHNHHHQLHHPRPVHRTGWHTALLVCNMPWETRGFEGVIYEWWPLLTESHNLTVVQKYTKLSYFSITQATSSGVLCSGLVPVQLSICPIGILTMTHQWAACDTVIVHFGPTIRSTNILVSLSLKLWPTDNSCWNSIITSTKNTFSCII